MNEKNQPDDDGATHQKTFASVCDVILKAQNLKVSYTSKDLNNTEFENRVNALFTSKVDTCINMARELGCPYTERDISVHGINAFMKQLYGIKRANQLAIGMGVGKLDFSVKTQSIQDYLKQQDSEAETTERRTRTRHTQKDKKAPSPRSCSSIS